MTAWIVIPAFQAELTLGDVVARISPELRRRCRVLVVDDGSRDRTSAVAAPLADVVLRSAQNLGYARSQKRGMTHALGQGASAVVILHADGQYPAEALADVLAPIERGHADVVLGSRVLDGGARKRGMPFYKFVANRVLTWFENRCSGLSLSEYHSGMMAYSRAALERLPFRAVSDSFHFDGELAMLAGRYGLRIAEVPIAHRYAGERSYLRPIPYGLTVMLISLAVKSGVYDRWIERRRVASEALP
jgi:glycosyltransferase involved in cell wall biosynthesis